jgi:hypothetical protein
VVQTIKDGLAFFQEHRTVLLNPPVITTAGELGRYEQ